jgi:hypothetical protein
VPQSCGRYKLRNAGWWWCQDTGLLSNRIGCQHGSAPVACCQARENQKWSWPPCAATRIGLWLSPAVTTQDSSSPCCLVACRYCDSRLRNRGELSCAISWHCQAHYTAAGSRVEQGHSQLYLQPSGLQWWHRSASLHQQMSCKLCHAWDGMFPRCVACRKILSQGCCFWYATGHRPKLYDCAVMVWLCHNSLSSNIAAVYQCCSCVCCKCENIRGPVAVLSGQPLGKGSLALLSADSHKFLTCVRSLYQVPMPPLTG